MTALNTTPAEARRSKIVAVLAAAQAPLSGSVLGRQLGVSRQIVVQDIALLRERGEKIVSTNRGYVLERGTGAGPMAAPAAPARPTRLFKCHHSVEDTARELQLIVDVGGCVEDVLVNHRIYGVVSSRLGIACRRDVERFMAELAAGTSAPLMQVTSGYHFHHVSAPSEEVLDEIAAELGAQGFLAPLAPYERDLA